ncbi:hypothetical protein CC80DRAFT_575439 [Byssothecium circinans]|uniref:Metalloendopeptidase n=1 Tax=Byssothecium circinans TaxID=147558 RepID=A0A6A5THU0_9PLEO|nr:hypothetical protein CC80DRAFT_575439 [Byssothecium circinans]
MKLLQVSALLLGNLLASIVTTSSIPFNNPEFLTNRTALREHIEAVYEAEQKGSADLISLNSPLRPWPRGTDGVTRIRYCYRNVAQYFFLRPHVEAGWGLWFNALGEPGNSNHHSLSFEEFKWQGTSLEWCRLDVDGVTWNPRVPADAVEVQASDELLEGGDIFAGATVGYKPYDWDSGNGRHSIFINHNKLEKEQPEVQTVIMAHEIGHVFGLQHEHQRSDRDHYVKFVCKNLPGYAETLDQVNHDGRWNMSEVCESPYLGSLFNFAATQYSTIPYWDRNHPNGHKYPWYTHSDRHYDVDSIMHYASYTMDWRKAALTAWIDGDITFEPPSEPWWGWSKIILQATKLTYWDVRGLRLLYPWSPE